MKNIFSAWWQVRGSRVTILSLDGSRTKISSADNLPSAVPQIEKYWTIDRHKQRKTTVGDDIFEYRMQEFSAMEQEQCAGIGSCTKR